MRQKALFQIAAACRFWWSGNSGITNFATGKTRDLGSRSVFVIADVIPSPGTLVMIEVDLPRAGDGSGHGQSDLLLRIEGTVSPEQHSEKEFVVMITFASLDRENGSDQPELLQENTNAPN